jgi:hypothetical protein
MRDLRGRSLESFIGVNQLAPFDCDTIGAFLFSMKKAYYFPHDYTASNDVKCLFLRQSLGMEGYGIFWFLVEQLANSGGQLPMEIIPVLAMQMQVTEAKVHAVITRFNLFKVDDQNFFWSERLNDHLEIRKSLSESGKKGSRARWENRVAIGEAITPTIGEGNAKENKGKEIKINEESHNEIFRKLWKSNIWLEGIAVKNKAKKEQVLNHLNNFRQECILKDEFKVDEKDAKQHFINWIKRGNPIPEKNAGETTYAKSTIQDNWW